MHAAFPTFSKEIINGINLGTKNKYITRQLDKIGGTFTAGAMALLLRVFGGVGFVSSLLSLFGWQSKKTLNYFTENFEIVDPAVKGGRRYYQGKSLFRTDKPGDNMNVMLKFCPEPERLFKNSLFGGRIPNPDAIVSTEVLTEETANAIENDPNKVDVVIYFKDVQTIMDLVGKPDVDLVNMLLGNLVHIKGNVGHIFKFGSIAANLKSILQPSK
jgi:hypothetical protein